MDNENLNPYDQMMPQLMIRIKTVKRIKNVKSMALQQELESVWQQEQPER